MPPTDDIDVLRRKLTHAEAVIAELRDVVAERRTQIDAQQAHIHRLVKMTVGRSSERVEGPTLFDGLDLQPDPTPAVVVEAAPEPRFPSESGRVTVVVGSRRTCRAARR